MSRVKNIAITCLFICFMVFMVGAIVAVSVGDWLDDDENKLTLIQQIRETWNGLFKWSF